MHFQNAAGHDYSLCYGFGVLHAMDLINKAKDWTQVDEQLTREVPGHLTRETKKIPSNGILTLKVNHYKHRVFLLSLGLFLFFLFLVGSRRCRFV